VAFNYEKKEVNLGNPFYPSGDIVEDLKLISTHFIDVKENPRI